MTLCVYQQQMSCQAKPEAKGMGGNACEIRQCYPVGEEAKADKSHLTKAWPAGQ